MTFTESQSGRPGRFGSAGGFRSGHSPSPPTFPAAATTTTFLTSTAYANAAPSARSSSPAAAATQAMDDTLITEAPMSAAVLTAMASVSTSPKPGADWPAGANLTLDCRMPMIVASGATPLNLAAPEDISV